jgi:dihydroorotase
VTHDLVVAGGHVLCPATGVDAVADVALDDGRIAAVGEGLTGRERLDAAGLLVVPGLIDLHVHVYDGVSHYGIDADRYLLRRGTTTGVDVGSAGAQTFPALRRMVVARAQTRVYAYLHIAVEGMISPLVGELEDIRWASVEQCVQVAEANRDVIAGVKLRAGYQMVGSDPRPALGLALEAAEALALPLMVHVIDMGMPLPDLLARMRPGDVVTHCFHGNEGGSLLEDHGKVWPEAFAARERGILFDVGHGVGSFTWRVARAALAQGFPPDTISSDIHAYNHAGPVHDLPRTLSKLLHLGLPLPAVIAAATARVGEHLAHVAPAGLGTLAVGAPGDLSLLERQHGSFALVDGEHRLSAGVTEYARERLVARSVVRGGLVVACDEPT